MASLALTASPNDLRKRYGDEIADIIETHSTLIAQHANRPSLQDIRATLQAIISDPETADVQGLGPLTRSLLMEPAWRRLRKQSLHALTIEELTDCANYALDHFPQFRNAIAERAEVVLTLSLLSAARTWHAARRDRLLREALSLVFRSRYERATAIIKTAHRELHAGT